MSESETLKLKLKQAKASAQRPLRVTDAELAVIMLRESFIAAQASPPSVFALARAVDSRDFAARSVRRGWSAVQERVPGGARRSGLRSRVVRAAEELRRQQRPKPYEDWWPLGHVSLR